MQPRQARWLTSLYPPAWRARYGDEFAAFLEERPATIGAAVNVVVSALRERARGVNGFTTMDNRQAALVMMTCAYLAAVAAGVNFYFSVDDTGLAVAMRGNVALGTSFRMVTNGSFFALATVLAVAVPIVASMLRTAFRTRRWDVVGRLLVPVGAALVTIAWMAAASAWTGGRWVPLPWDVGGALQSWPAPPDWPPLAVRQPLAAVTFVLLVARLVASAAGVARAIAHTDLSGHRPIWLKVTSVSLACSIVVMAIGVMSWGLFAQQYAQADFHARNGGFFSGTNFASWLASAIVFVASAWMGLRAARSAIQSEPIA
jgi:hypothetical protein